MSFPILRPVIQHANSTYHSTRFTMKFSVISTVALFAGLSLAFPKSTDSAVGGTEGGLLEARICCTCSDGRKGCGGFCYSNCPQCIGKKC
ncbi:hypothetical protein Cob_v010941 [Colletotrichum orbiculare MAFF 240422]|uniref:Uncharacterized protein n=1 Tax=Colletotrichum orbiculare (strain 104-T / ATCC 96160 / CBS 514.97 / LARS 414 / MAFF 240422) TaxID=1213857 RepID=A0A484FCK5_COLOR|nr:hypothetical protein Cob_v010941 [Colletotrichum orbiculare MAFF 240422]